MHQPHGGLGESYFRNSRKEDPLYSPISSPPRTSKSYDQPYINGEVLLEEIPFAGARPASSLDQSKRTNVTNTSSKLGGSPQPRRWRLIPASCTCPVHGASQDYGVGSTSSSFISEDGSTQHHEYHSRFTSSRGKILDEELDRLKGSVHQLESDVLHKLPRKKSPGKTFRTSTIRERTEIESTRKELESELKGWQVKLLDQMEALKKKLDHETSQRSAKEHDLIYKTNQCDRLQRQLDDALQRLRSAEDRIVDLTASKNKAKERLREVMEEHEYSLNRSIDNSKVADDVRRMLEHEMEVRVQLENELQNLQKLVERGMGDSQESRKALDAKTRELEDIKITNSRLERELYSLKSTVDQEKVRFNSELERKEFDCQQLRDQLSLVTSQLEREREAHQEQVREKIQELNRLKQELQRLQTRISELEAMLEKSNNKNRHSDGEAEQQRLKIIDLENIRGRLEAEVNQLQGRMRNADRDRERMVAAIHDLQSQVDVLQSKTDTHSHISDQEHTRLVLIIRDLEAQIEELTKRVVDEREHAAKLAGEVDETNSALDEVRAALEKEMELRKEAERENGLLQKMFEDEVKQWRAKEDEWEKERTELREHGWDELEQEKFDRLQADIERLEVEEQDRIKEIEERDAMIESLREQLSEVERSRGGSKSDFEERMRMEVEGFQEQVKDLCIQLEESAQKLEKESKARADAETSKKRLEKALLELNAKLQATPTKSNKDTDSQIAALKEKIARLEDELARWRLDDFEFDPEMLYVEDDDIEETGDHVRVKLSDIQRVLRKLNQLVSDHHFTRYTREVERHETEETREGGREEEEEVVEDEEEGSGEERGPNGHVEETQEEEEEEHEEESSEEQEVIEAPTTPNGTKHVHFGTPSPPATPSPPSPLSPSSPHSPSLSSPPSTPPTKDTTPPSTPPKDTTTTTPPRTPPSPTTATPASPTTTPQNQRNPLLPSNEAEHDRLNSEWKRRVASSANKYTHSRVPLTSVKRLYPDTPSKLAPPSPSKTIEREVIKSKIENLRKSVSEDRPVPSTPTQPGPAPGFYYVPEKSDEIDEKLSSVVSETDTSKLVDIPKNFKRVDKGVYQFGTKKIHMQIRDGDLVVRVGGGFMKFFEFLAKHAQVENVKFQKAGMSFAKKRESVSKPLKKKTLQEKSQNTMTPSKWEPLFEEDQN